MKRKNYILWDEFFMGVARLASLRSKDPSTRHGAIIVNSLTNRIVSVGYSGLPTGLNDDGLDIRTNLNSFTPSMVPKEGFVFDYWAAPQKYDYVCHGEENCILNATCDLNAFDWRPGRHMFKMAGVKTRLLDKPLK